MKKSIILPLAVVVVLAVVGGAAYFVTSKNDDKNAQKTSTTSSASQPQADSAETAFNPVAMTGVSYEATLTSQKDGKTFTATLKYDGKGNSEFSSEQNGKQIRIVMTKDAYYSCQGSTCYKMDSTNASGFDPNTYQYSADEINSLKQNAKYIGTEACGTQTCEVWEVTQDTTNGKVYIDQSTKRIMKATGNYGGDSGELVFVYKPVTIEVPANAQTVTQ